MKKCALVAVVALSCLAAPLATASAREHPAVSHFSFAPSTFAVASGGAAAASGAHRATTIGFQLARRSTVTIAIARKLAGRRAGGRCVKSTSRLRSRRACTRYVTAGRLHPGSQKAGSNALGFSGRIGGRALKPGSYRARITATQRHRSTHRTTTFTVARSASSAGAAPPPAAAPPAPPAPGGFPSPATTGVPAGWVPAQTRTTDLHVTTAGAVVQDVLLQNANISVEAPNVTIRRVQLQGGSINNNCNNGMTVEDSTIEPAPGQTSSVDSEAVISTGGYTARGVKIWRRAEGFRVGGAPQCGPVRIENSFAKIVIPSGHCELHSDGIQGYYGNAVAVVNSTIDFAEASCGTAPFFVPKNQGNTSATVDRLLLVGGGNSFRMGVPGTVSGLKIVDKSWGYGPIDVACSLVSSWDASIVTITSDYQVASTVRSQPCNTQGGG